MIEFTGYLTGAAEKAFIKRQRKTSLTILGVMVPLSLPTTFFVSVYLLRDIRILYAILAVLLLWGVIAIIPKGKKEHMSYLPKRIYVEETHIVCITENDSTSKLISDVKKVIDYGEYYILYFPFGKSYDGFICQKNLLTKGSLEAFESLFEGKLIKKGS